MKLKVIEDSDQTWVSTALATTSTNPQRASSPSPPPPPTTATTPATLSRRTEAESADADKEVEFLYEQDFYKIREDCLKRDALFEDPEFPGVVTNDAFSALMKITTINSGSKNLGFVAF